MGEDMGNLVDYLLNYFMVPIISTEFNSVFKNIYTAAVMHRCKKSCQQSFRVDFR